MAAPISRNFLITTALLGGALLAGGLTDRRVADKLVLPIDSIATEIAGWTSTGNWTLPEATRKTLNATTYLSRGYRKGDRSLDLFIAYYEQQRAGESMHSPKHCLPGAGWEIWQLGSASVAIDGAQFQINKDSISNAGQRMLMFYWYQSKDRITASEYLGKLLLVRDTLVTGRTAGSIVRVTLPDTAGATEEGLAFAAELIPRWWRCMGKN